MQIQTSQGITGQFATGTPAQASYAPWWGLLRLRHAACTVALAGFCLAAPVAPTAQARTLAQGGLTGVTSVAEAPRQATRPHLRLSRDNPAAKLARARLMALDGDRLGSLRLVRRIRTDANDAALGPRLLKNIERPAAGHAGGHLAHDPGTQIHFAVGRVGAGGESLQRNTLLLRSDPWDRFDLVASVGRTRLSQGSDTAEVSQLTLGGQESFARGIVYATAGLSQRAESGRAQPRDLEYRTWLAMAVQPGLSLRVLSDRRPLHTLAATRRAISATRVGVEPHLQLARGHSLRIKLEQTRFSDDNYRAKARVDSQHALSFGTLFSSWVWAQHGAQTPEYWSVDQYESASLAVGIPRPMRPNLLGRAHFELGYERESGASRPWGALSLEVLWRPTKMASLAIRWGIDPRPHVHDGGRTAHGLAIRTGWEF